MTTYTRSQWGARAAKGGPGSLQELRVIGIALHWPAMSKPLTSVAAVMAALRDWQNYHMDDQGWSDIGYQAAVDQAGNRYNLRGLRIQSGANGNTEVNQRYGAVLLVLAPGEEPSVAMIAEVRKIIAEHRALFPNSAQIVGHSQIRPEATACPGPAVQKHIGLGTFAPQAKKRKSRPKVIRTELNRLRAFRNKSKGVRRRRLQRVINFMRKTFPPR